MNPACGKLIFTLACATFFCALSSSAPHPANTVSISTKWVRTSYSHEYLGARLLHRMTPIVLKNKVIFGNSHDGIAALDRVTGQNLWKIRVENGVEGGAQIVGKTIYFGGGDGQFYAANIDNGQVQWTFPVRAQSLARPLVKNSVVYFISGNNVVYALDASTGKQLWLHKRTDTTPLSVRGGGRPVLHSGRLYIGTSDGFLVALSSHDGSLIWERRLSTNSRFTDIDTSPKIHRERIFISSYDGELFCLSRDDGQILWRQKKGSHADLSLVGEKIFYSTSEGEVIALSHANGEVSWTFKVKSGVASRPIYHRGSLIFGETSGALRVISAKTGQEIANYNTGRGISASPAVMSSGEVYLTSNDGNLFALKINRSTRNQLWPWMERSL